MRGNQLPVSGARLASWVPDMFRNFYLVKSLKIANNLTTTEIRVKISKDLESLEF